nr:probable E3 ubiquitin-protein ligase BAH1-like 1 [Ipomoea batatas]
MKNSSIIHSSMKQMTKMVKHFNTPVHNFLVVSRIFQKHFKFPIRKKLQQRAGCSLQEQINPEFCAVMKSKAALRILKKYEKVLNYNGLVNRMFECNTDMQVMMKSSACALELMALQINSKHETKLFDQWLFLADDGPSSLSVTLQDSTVLNVDLTCPICLLRHLLRRLVLTKPSHVAHLLMKADHEVRRREPLRHRRRSRQHSHRFLQMRISFATTVAGRSSMPKCDGGIPEEDP